MPDFGAPVAQNVDVNPLRTIGQIIGLQGAQLDLQHKRQALQGQAAEVQQQQQTARQRAGIADIDWGKYDGEDGTLDLNKFYKDKAVQAKAGDAYPDLVNTVLQIKQHQTENKEKLLTLNNAQLAAFGSVVGGLRSDPDVTADNPAGRQKFAAAMDQFGKAYGPDAARIAQTFAPIAQHAPPGKLAHGIEVLQLQANDAGRQLGLQAPNLTPVSTGATTEIRNTNPYAPEGITMPQSFTNKVPPGAILTQDLRGAPFIVNPQNPGSPQPVGAGNAQQPNANGFQNPTYAGQASDIQANQTEVRGIRQQADTAPLNRSINQNILRLSADAKTGPGTEIWQHALGALGAPFGLSANASYQEVGKFLEKNAIANMQAMGAPGSDARLHAAAAANGSTSFNKQALQDVTKFNDATNTALIKYRQGIDQAIGTRNPNYTDLPRFKAEWAKNFDVNIFRAENAIRDNDTEELAKIKKELGPARMRELAQKRRNLESLSSTGELPRG